MKKLSVSELAKLYGYSRQAVYAHIKKGNLSKGSDGLIDFSEALRVFGEPQKSNSSVNQSQSTSRHNLTEVDLLKRQVDMLEKQLNQAIQSIPVPEHIEPTPKKRGFLSRFFLPYG